MNNHNVVKKKSNKIYSNDFVYRCKVKQTRKKKWAWDINPIQTGLFWIFSDGGGGFAPPPPPTSSTPYPP